MKRQRMIYLVSATVGGRSKTTTLLNRKIACRVASMFADGQVHAMPWLAYKDAAPWDAPTFRACGECVYRTADHYPSDTVRAFA